MPEDAQIAVPSPAPVVDTPAPVEVETDGTEEAVAAKDFTSYREKATDRALGRKAEQAPTPTKKTEPAPVKAEAPPVDPARVAPEAPPADSAAAKPKLSEGGRVQQLLVERARERQESARQLQEARAELERYKAGAKPTESPKPQPQALDVAEPQRSDYTLLEDYEQAWREYPKKVVAAELAKAKAADQAERQRTERDQYEAEVMAGWEERFETAIEAHSNPKQFEEHVAQAAQVFHEAPGITEYIMTDAEDGLRMAEILGQDLRRAHALLKITRPIKLAQALAELKIEARGGQTRSVNAPAPVPTLPAPPKPVSTPPPTRELSTAASSEANVDDHMVNTKDFAGYRERHIAKELANRRR